MRQQSKPAETRECPACVGIGELTYTLVILTCPMCGGSGKVPK